MVGCILVFQLPAYLADNPALHGRYKRWLWRSASRSEEGEEWSDDGGGGGAGSAVGAGASASSAVAEGEGGGGGAAGAGVPATAAAAAAASPSSTAVPSSSALADCSAQGAVDDSSEEQREQERAPSAGAPNVPTATLSPPCLPSRGASGDGGGVGSGGGGGSSISGNSAAGGAKDSFSPLTPPLAFRTRSRGRPGAGLPGLGRASEQNSGENLEQRERGRGEEGAAAAGGGGEAAGAGEESQEPVEMGKVSPPPRGRSPGVAASPPPPPTSSSSETSGQEGRCGGAPVPGRQRVRGSGAVVGWESSERAPRSSKGKGRRKTLVVVAGGGVAGRLVGSGHRAGAVAKR